MMEVRVGGLRWLKPVAMVWNSGRRVVVVERRERTPPDPCRRLLESFSRGSVEKFPSITKSWLLVSSDWHQSTSLFRVCTMLLAVSVVRLLLPFPFNVFFISWNIFDNSSKK